MKSHYKTSFTYESDRRNILHRIVGEPPECGVGRVAGREQNQCVPIGVRSHRGFNADRAAATWSVVDDHGLPKALGKFLRKQARGDVRAPAGREWHNETDGSGRVTLLRADAPDLQEDNDDCSYRPMFTHILPRGCALLARNGGA